MAEQESTEEKTEEPTAKRLQKAREDGQVARSQELSVAAMMIGVASFMYLFGGPLIIKLGDVFRVGFIFDRKDIYSDTLLPVAFGSHALNSFAVIMPIFLLAIIIAIGAAGMIGGYNFSLKAIAPKGNKLNPLNGFKRMFGMQAFVNLAKAIAKFGLVGGTLYLVVSGNFKELTALGFMDVEPAMSNAGGLIGFGAVLVTLTLIIAAAIDVPYQLYEHNKKIKDD
jgi:flagellar biosynthetic protein FlhB